MPIVRALLICLQFHAISCLPLALLLLKRAGTSVAALKGMSNPTERWVLTAGLEPRVAESLRRVLEEQGSEFNYRVEAFDSQQSLLEQYREFTEHPEHQWVSLLGRGGAADLFVEDYYSFLSLRPPHTLILLSPSVTAFHLNKLSCPYLIIHGECDPLLRTVPHSAFDRAIYHHQMRYGDPTTDYIAPSDDRFLTVQRPDGPELDPLVIRQITEWLSLTPDLGSSKEGLHARGFRAYATRVKKAS
jgi:pimeloyl-ACP methyl ester carboxylesterase